MNFAKDCLEKNGWDYDKAVQNFYQLQVPFSHLFASTKSIKASASPRSFRKSVLSEQLRLKVSKGNCVCSHQEQTVD